MIRPNKDRIFSAPGIFAIYIFISFVLVLVFRMIFPASEPPLPYFRTQWLYLQGILEFLNLYPAIALSALILFFGVKIVPAEKMQSFSSKFLRFIKPSVFTAIGAAVLYALVSLLALPLARDYESGLRYQGDLFITAKEGAEKAALEGDWEDAAMLAAICERIWPGELTELATEANIRLEESQFLRTGYDINTDSSFPVLSGQEPVNATEALIMAERAYNEERYFDSHWLASLAGRLAGPGSAETSRAIRMASQAWDAINSLEPNARETELVRIFRYKREGFEALMNENWISAYYIFLDLASITPNDPDVAKYLSLAEQGCRTIAFFFDELDFALGNTLTGRIFSFPSGLGRMVVRIGSLTIFPDSAYGSGLEILAFDENSKPAWRASAQYVKLLPYGTRSGSGVGLLCHVLDREDKNRSWEPEIEALGENPPQQLGFDVGWDDFLLLAGLYRRIDYIPMSEVLAAAKIAGNYGYMPEIFQVEFLGRLANILLFLVMAVASLSIGWRYRAQKKPLYFLLPVMVLLPVINNWLMYFFRNLISNATILSVMALGFNISIVIFSAIALTIFVGSLILLAAQHE